MLLTRNPRFLLLWLGQFLSQAGVRLGQIALLWWIMTSEIQGSGKEVGLFMVLAALPPLLLAGAVGRLVDRRPLQGLLAGSALACALASCVAAALLYGSRLDFWGACAANLLLSALQALADPALNKAAAELVEGPDIEGAVALQASTQSLAYFGGAVAGAGLIDVAGVAGALAVQAGGYLAAAGLYAAIGRWSGLAVAAAKAPTADGAVGKDAVSGWTVLAGMPLMRKVLIAFGVVNFFVTPTLVILPLYAAHTLKAGASVLAVLEAGLWSGLLAGAVASRWVGAAKGTIRLGAACLAAQAVAFLAAGIVVRGWVYFAALAIVGLALGVNNVKFIALFQRSVAPEVKGRFFAILQAVTSFTFPAAFLVFGLLADLLSPPAVCLVQGAGVAVLCVYFLGLARQEDGGQATVSANVSGTARPAADESSLPRAAAPDASRSAAA